MKQPPQDLDAENQFLAAVFVMGATALDSVETALVPSDFYQTPHQLIFKAVLTLKSKGTGVDLVTVANQLAESGDLKKAGGASTLGKIANDAVSLNPAGHAEIIKNCAKKRELAALGARITSGALNGESVSELLAMVKDQTSTISQSAGARFRLTRLSDIEIKPPDWQIYGLMERDSLNLLFSNPGEAKTFLAIDQACCAATGKDFHGRSVRQGPVIYIAGEGQNGLKRRFMAWGIRHGYDLDKYPIFLSMVPAGLCSPDQVEFVINAIEKVASQEGDPVLIVLDTVARNFGPGDENSTKDMSGFISGVDKIREISRSCILLVHHSGHGDKSRGRGSMALKGALDTEYRLEKDDMGTIRVTNSKMKDHIPPAPMAFKLNSVELPFLDDQGQPITSAVLDGTEYTPPASGKKGRGLGKWQTICQGILSDLFEEHRRNLEKGNFDPNDAKVLISDVKEKAILKGVPSKHWNRYFNDLSKLDGITVNHPYFELVPHSSPNDPNGEERG